MDLTALTSFNSVATHGGFGHASRSTGQPKATLSRHVRELEESLGVRLIERGGQTLRLTEEGAALHAQTDRLLGEIKDAGQAVVGGMAQPRGPAWCMDRHWSSGRLLNNLSCLASPSVRRR